MRIASHMEHAEWDGMYMTYQHDVTKTNYKMYNTHSYFSKYERVYNDVIKVWQ